MFALWPLERRPVLGRRTAWGGGLRSPKCLLANVLHLDNIDAGLTSWTTFMALNDTGTRLFASD